MSTDINPGKAELSKKIQSGESVGPLMEVDFSLAKTFLVLFLTTASYSAIDRAIRRKMRERGVVRSRKGITLTISVDDKWHYQNYKITGKFECID